ncbi:MAG: molybdopterin-synthase adenylyltransferase MoeB [Pseudomonadota bacterium]
MDTDAFCAEELQFYQRQLLLPEVGLEGQRALKRARILVIGAGGLGSPVLLYLAAAGVGTLGIVEHDHVDRSNLHRQILFDVQGIGQPKAGQARQRLQALNPHVNVVVHGCKLESHNARTLVQGYDVVVDATDNFRARYLINEACVREGKPNVSASILRFEGQLSVFVPGEGPCYQCLFPQAPPPHLAPSCAEAGVLGVLPGAIGTLQALEAIKLAMGLPSSLVGKLLSFDAMAMRFKTLEIARDAACPVCGGVQAARAQVTAAPAAKAEVRSLGCEALAGWLSASAAQPQQPWLLDVRREAEYRQGHVEGATLVPLDQLAGSVHTIPRGRPVVCICQKGVRSRIAAQMLVELGFAEVYSLEGGMDAWESAVEADDDPRQPACGACESCASEAMACPSGAA